ncbi:MAG: hypothetical protein KIT87_22585, partial [Anaerolineae bacterium]|nr:hypothetical protein [Anaerolineae bacterium]
DVDVHQWRNRLGGSILDYLQPRADEFARSSPTNAGKLIVALVASGQDPRSFGSVNFLARLQDQYDPSRGRYGGRAGTVADQAWALLALAATREPAPEAVAQALLVAETPEAGWGATGRPDVETTALVLAALISAGLPVDAPALNRGVSVLGLAQTATGGFARAPGCGCAADALSTARAVQAILMTGRDPLTTGWRRAGGLPTDWLRFQQDLDGGLSRVSFGHPDPVSTAYGISALLGRPLPPQGRAPATRSALGWLGLRQIGGGFAPAGTTPDVDFTLDALFALTATASPLDRWQGGDRAALLDLLAAYAPRSTAAGLGRLILGVVALGGDPRNFTGVDLLRRLDAFYSAGPGVYGDTAPDQAWALLALAAVHRLPPRAALDRLTNLQTADGGWRPRPTSDPDTVTTALAIQALGTVAGYDQPRQRGRTYLLLRLQPDGGLSMASGLYVSSTRATAAGLLALASLRESPASAAWTRHAVRLEASALPANNPFRFLLAMQNADGGFRPQPDFPETDPQAAVAALAALAGRPQPVTWELLHLYMPLFERAALRR